MAIQKRFIHFKKFSDFNSKKLSANEANTQYTVGVSGEVQDGEPDILYQSYVWIKDEQKQWTHGQLYDGKAFSGLVEITYEELKELRDNSQLVSGQQYRIIDYVTTTVQTDTQSAGHQFDIIVTADDVNTLNEKARATLHEGDTYFVNNNLNAWELWYCLDNDTSRFYWANSTNGKGVIYRMMDEYHNDCPYDFKNIQFKRYTVTSEDSTLANIKTILESSYVGVNVSSDYNTGQVMPNTLSIKDENDYKWFYTFNCLENDVITDSSVKNTLCKSNIIHYCNIDNIQKLNNIVLSNSSSITTKNEFKPDCYCITIGNLSLEDSSNLFSNIFDQNSRANIFLSPAVYQNMFGGNMVFNIFTGIVAENQIGNYFQYNILAKFAYNSIGHHSTNNICYGEMSTNSIGSSFTQNTINTKLNMCSIGPVVRYNTFTNIVQCVIEYGCQYNTIDYAVNSTFKMMFQRNVIAQVSACTFGSGFRYNVFKTSPDLNGDNRPYIQGCIFGNYVWYNNFYNTTEASSSNAIKNLNVPSYFQGTDTAYNVVEVPTGANYEVKIVKNSKGEIKVYCEADLIA